jgi:hypothetical protein
MCRPVGDPACQARGQLLGAGDVELAPRAHEVDAWGGHARRKQQPVARIHYGPKPAPGRSGRGLGRGIRDTFEGTCPITIRSPPWHRKRGRQPD